MALVEEVAQIVFKLKTPQLYTPIDAVINSGYHAHPLRDGRGTI